MAPPPLLPPPPLPIPPTAFSSNQLPEDRSRLSTGLGKAREEEQQPSRGGDEDYDLISGWARSLSVSPRLYPTYSSSHLHSGESSAFGGGYKPMGLDGSPLLGPRRPGEALLLSVGNGLSPLLGPTTSLGGGGGAFTSMSGGGGYDYSYNGNGGSFHASSRSNHHLSPATHPLAAGSPNLSFSNLLDHNLSHHNLSLSPPVMNLALPHTASKAPTPSVSAALSSASADKEEMPPPPIPQPKPERRLSLSTSSSSTQLLPAAPSSSTIDPSHMSTEDIKLEEVGAIPAEEDPRIRAYAKLEFPTFDMYIQKLSVIIGRRPAPVVPVAVSPSIGNTDLSLLTIAEGEPSKRKVEEVKLEDFVRGLEDDVVLPSAGLGLVEVVETVAEVVKSVEEDPKGEAAVTLLITPSSPPADESKGDETALDIAQFLKSSSPTVAADQPSLPPAPVADKKPIIQEVDARIDPPPAVAAPVPEAPATIVTDIDLGPIRAVSRQHARLYFDYELGSWAIEVLGRNGVVVEGKWKAKGEIETLGRRTRIQIAERIFYFVLPTVDPPLTNGDDEAPEEAPMSEGNDAENDSSSLSEVSDSDIELSPLMSAVTTAATLPDLSSLPPLPSNSSFKLKLPAEPVAPTSIVPLGRGRRLSSSKRVNYYDQGQQGDEEASTSRIKPVASGKNVKLVQAARSGGKGKGGGGKGGKAGKGKMSYDSMPPHPLDAPSPMGRGGKGGKGKKAGKTPSQIKKARMSFNNAFDSDEDDDMEMEEFYDDEEDELNEEDFYGEEEEMYEYNEVAIKKEEIIGEDGQVIPPPVVVKKEKISQAKKAPRKAKKAQPVLTSLPPLPALPLLPTTPAATTLGPVPYPLGPAPGSTLSTASSGSSIIVDPYALPSPADANNPTQNLDGMGIPAMTLQDGAGGGMDRGSSVKRGRGRPPKNGICAQRPRKPRPKPNLDANGVELPREKAAPAAPALPRPRQTSAVSSNVSPYTLPPFPSTDAASAAVNATLNTTTFTPTVYAPGEEPPSAADPADLFAKPPFTYASLIAQAVMQADEKKMTLNAIYDWITLKWPYFSDNQNGWQNSIRHNLTLSRGFLKVPRRADEPGKGAFWMIDPAQARNFDGFNFRKKTIKPAAATGQAQVTIGPPRPIPVAAPRLPSAGPSNAAPRPPNPAVRPPAKPVGPRPTGGPNKAPLAAPSLSQPLPIVISPIPKSYVRPPPPPSATPPDELTAVLLKDPPIVLHEGKLILNPTIFAQLTAAQLGDLQKIPASKALEILQAFVVSYFKERMKRGAFGGAIKPGAGAGAGAGAAGKPGPGVRPMAGGAGPSGGTKLAPNANGSNSKVVPKVATPSPIPSATASPAPSSTPVASASSTSNGMKRKAEKVDDEDEVEILPNKSAKVAAGAVAKPSGVVS